VELYLKYSDFWNNCSDEMYKRWRDRAPWMARRIVPWIPSGASVLDVGCGQGLLYEKLDNKLIKYTGIDSSKGMLNCFRERHPEADLLECDILSTTLSDKSYDVVVCINTLMYFNESLCRLFTEIRRLAFHTVIFNAPVSYLAYEDDDRYVFGWADIIGAMTEADLFPCQHLEIVDLNEHEYFLFRIDK
jgi:ubiquinone/menaquinone biosynthesis C-methylase UbiE